MKKTILTLLTAITAFASQDQFASPPPVPPEVLPAPKQGFFYVRFAAAEDNFARTGSVLPGLGVGYRRLAGSNGAADISFSGIGHAEKKNSRAVWTAPKASYLHYFQPDAKQSAYLGAGLAWGGVESQKESQSFVGIIPSATAGYEFVHRGSILGFTELTVSQPALPVFHKGPFPGPNAELSVGIGF